MMVLSISSPEPEPPEEGISDAMLRKLMERSGCKESKVYEGVIKIGDFEN